MIVAEALSLDSFKALLLICKKQAFQIPKPFLSKKDVPLQIKTLLFKAI